MTDQTDAKVDETHSKDVTIVAYLSNDSISDQREAMAEVMPETDWEEQTTTEEEKHYLKVGGYKTRLFGSDWEEVRDKNLGEGKAVTEIEHSTDYSYRTGHFERNVRDAITEGMVVNPRPEEWTQQYDYKVHKDYNVKFRVSVKAPTTMGLLKHQSEASVDDIWSDEDAELWCYIVTVSISDVAESDLDFFNDEVIPVLMDRVQSRPEVGRTRLMDCETTVNKKGACYEVF